MLKQVVCPICGAVFETNKPHKKYCSFSCKEAGAKLRRMKWEDNNPDYIRAYMKQYRKKGKSKLKTEDLSKVNDLQLTDNLSADDKGNYEEYCRQCKEEHIREQFVDSMHKVFNDD